MRRHSFRVPILLLRVVLLCPAGGGARRASPPPPPRRSSLPPAVLLHGVAEATYLMNEMDGKALDTTRLGY
jgi:hypothetical protein